MHDVPWPVDFGGVFDLYYKLKSLHEAGIKIHLHCFVNKRPPQSALEKYCEEVHYYKRKKFSFSMKLPYIVSSRRSDELLRNLQKDHHPVLLEGIHCSYHLFTGALKDRKVLLRLHNAEFKYYEQLARNESNPLKRIYYSTESKQLKKYEHAVACKARVICVSETDKEIYQQEFSAQDIFFLPVFLPWQDVISKNGKGDYCLYNGNLSVNENENAALWLISEVFSKNEIPFIIAGKSPSEKLKSAVKKYPNIQLVADPAETAMQQLVENAQINVLPSMNATGVKLKLLNALFNGRFCLTNAAGCTGSGLEELCDIEEDAAGFTAKIALLCNLSFNEAQTEKRRSALSLICNNELNARKLIAWVW